MNRFKRPHKSQIGKINKYLTRAMIVRIQKCHQKILEN